MSQNTKMIQTVVVLSLLIIKFNCEQNSNEFSGNLCQNGGECIGEVNASYKCLNRK